MDCKMEAIDWISGLPPFIIHHVMSFLEPKQVVQTSVLSKTWYHLWQCYPVLDFDQTHFLVPELVNYDHRQCCESIGKFAEFVDNFMGRFCELKLRIQKFRLSICAVDVERCSMIDKWIELAIKNDVREIDLCFHEFGDTSYTLPQTVFSARCIRALRMYGCSWMQPFASYNFHFHFLEKLFLGGVYVSEEMIQKLTSKCPLLEDFSLNNCWGLKCFDVSTFSKVKVVLLEEVNDLDMIKIAALTLQSFTLCRCRTTSCMINLEGCKNLKTLYLLYSKISDQEFHNLIPTLPLLEELSVHFCGCLKRVKISSERLKKLDIVVRDTLMEVFDIATPNLQEFRYRGWWLPCAYSINAPCQWFINFSFLYTFDLLDCLKLKQFLGTANQIVELGLSFGKDLINLPQLRENSPCLPREIRNVHLYVSLPESHYSTLLDYLLWVCYPKTLSVIVNPADKVHFSKWLYEEVMKRDVSCCGSCNIKCWRHNLKAISIRNFTRIGSSKEHVSLETLMDAKSTPPLGKVCFSLVWYPHALDMIA